MKEFGQILKELRTRENLSQEGLGNIVHVSRSAIAKYENGLGLPGEEVVSALCNYFKVDKDYLFPKKDIEKLITNKNIVINKQRKKNIIITLALSIVIVVLLIFIALFNNDSINIDKEKAVILEDVEEIIDLNGLDNYDKVGLLMKYEGGYVYQRIEIHRINFTDSTNLYLIKVHNTYNNGYMSYINGQQEYNQNEYTNKVFMGINFKPAENYISFGSWHQKYSTSFRFTSLLNRGGEYIIEDEINLLDGASIQKENRRFLFSYDSCITDYLLDIEYNNIIRKCTINNGNYNSSWEYEMLNEETKSKSFTITSSYLIEASSNQEICFDVSTKMNNTSMFIKQTKRIKLYT